MGKDLERALWRMYAPHKVKLAVSGCPRNCAESGIKDVGVIGVDSGWEIHVAGNGGIKTEVAQFLCKLKTAAEVLEYSGAFLQLYREEGFYLERTLHYVNRVGLDYVKKKILEDHDLRRARRIVVVDADEVRAFDLLEEPGVVIAQSAGPDHSHPHRPDREACHTITPRCDASMKPVDTSPADHRHPVQDNN